MTGKAPANPPGGLLGWVLDDEARTARARSLLYPMYTAVVVIAICLVIVAMVVVGHVPALVAEAICGSGLLGVGIPVAVRRWRAHNARDHAGDVRRGEHGQ